MKLPLAALLPTMMLAGAVMVTSVTAQPQMDLGKPDPARVTAGRYTVDAGHTLVGWRVDHFGFNDYFGIFGDVSGSLEIDPANLAGAKLDVTIPVAKVTVASAGLRDHFLRPGKDGGKPDFFGPEPVDARFVSTAVNPTSATTATITGNLTLNGVTRPVAIAAKFTGAGANPMNKRMTVGFEGRAEIKRSEFGIVYGIPMVGDTVELDITAAFEKS